MNAVIDSDIFSSFSKIGRVDLIENLFKIHLVPAVYGELEHANKIGLNFEIKKFARIELSKKELEEAQKIAERFLLGKGETECLAVAASRKIIFLSNDSKAISYAKENRITYFDLTMILRLLWKEGICNKEELTKTIGDLENKDFMVIKNKEQLFKD